MQKELYDRMTEDPTGLCKQENTKTLRFFKFLHLMWLAQMIGAFRDERYYREKIKLIENKIS